MTLGESAVFDTEDTMGNPYRINYTYTGQDPITGKSNYDITTTDTGIYGPPLESAVNIQEVTSKVPKLGALGQGAACLIDGIVDAAVDLVEDTIDTAMGKLKEEATGGLLKALGLDDKGGNLIQGLARDCIISGINKVTSDVGSFAKNEAVGLADPNASVEGVADRASATAAGKDSIKTKIKLYKVS